MTIYSAKYDHDNKNDEFILSWINGKDWKIWGVGGGYLMNNDYILDGVLDKIKLIIATEKFDDDKILTKAGKKFTDEITIKNVVILIACVIKDGDKCIHSYFQKKH